MQAHSLNLQKHTFRLMMFIWEELFENFLNSFIPEHVRGDASAGDR